MMRPNRWSLPLLSSFRPPAKNACLPGRTAWRSRPCGSHYRRSWTSDEVRGKSLDTRYGAGKVLFLQSSMRFDIDETCDIYPLPSADPALPSLFSLPMSISSCDATSSLFDSRVDFFVSNDKIASQPLPRSIRA